MIRADPRQFDLFPPPPVPKLTCFTDGVVGKCVALPPPIRCYGTWCVDNPHCIRAREEAGGEPSPAYLPESLAKFLAWKAAR